MGFDLFAMKTPPTGAGGRQNHLLAALPDSEYEPLARKLEYVDLKLGQVIYESGDVPRYLYFPTTAIVSMLYVMENGGTAEIGIAGNNGLVGYALFMGGKSTSSRAIVQVAGQAARLGSEAALAAFAAGGVFQKILLLYMQALITQISQTAVCNRLHSVEQQLCRWLLINHDQLPADKLIMTQDLIANMLGVRREGVSVAASNLQAAGVIEYSRGTITIVDREKLEAAACECYQVVVDEYTRLLGEYIPVNDAGFFTRQRTDR
jgi:CRP-like cAMP-binding protein